MYNYIIKRILGVVLILLIVSCVSYTFTKDVHELPPELQVVKSCFMGFVGGLIYAAEIIAVWCTIRWLMR